MVYGKSELKGGHEKMYAKRFLMTTYGINMCDWKCKPKNRPRLAE
jgi:hypothetical protein